MKLVRGCVVFLLMLSAAWVAPGGTQAADGPEMVLDRGSLGTNNVLASLERFEIPEVFPGRRFLVTFDDVNYRSTSPKNPYWQTSGHYLSRDFTDDGSPTGPLDSLYDMELTFGTDQAVSAIGFALIHPEDRETDPFEFTLVEADGTSTMFPLDLNDTSRGFVGFTSETGIVSVTIHERMDDDGSLINFGLDNVERSPIGEIEYTNVAATRPGKDHARLVLQGVIELPRGLQLGTVGAEVKLADGDLWWDPGSGTPVAGPVVFTVQPVPTDGPRGYTFTTTLDLLRDPPADPPSDFEPVIATIVVDTAFVDTDTPGPTFRRASTTIAIPAYVPAELLRGGVRRLQTDRPESDISVNLFERAADGSRGRYLGNSKTKSDGRYLHLVEPGCYVLTFIAPVGNHFLDHRTGPGNRYLNRSVCLTAGQRPLVDATILADESVNASISGQATLDGGSPVGGVNVTLFLADTTTGYTQRGQYLGSTRTGDDGGYRHDVAAGCYVLTFIAQAGDEFSNGNRYLNRSVCVDDANQLGDIDVTLSRGG